MQELDESFRGQLILRSVSGAFIVAVVLGALFAGGWFWIAVASAVALLSLWEFYSLLSTRYRLSRGLGMAAPLIKLFEWCHQTAASFRTGPRPKVLRIRCASGAAYEKGPSIPTRTGPKESEDVASP